MICILRCHDPISHHPCILRKHAAHMPGSGPCTGCSSLWSTLLRCPHSHPLPAFMSPAQRPPSLSPPYLLTPLHFSPKHFSSPYYIFVRHLPPPIKMSAPQGKDLSVHCSTPEPRTVPRTHWVINIVEKVNGKTEFQIRTQDSSPSKGQERCTRRREQPRGHHG